MVGEGCSLLCLPFDVDDQGEVPAVVRRKQTLLVVVIVEIGADEHAGLPAAQQVHAVPPFADICPALIRPMVIGLGYGFVQASPILKFHRPMQFVEFVPELLGRQVEILGEGAEDPLQHQLSFTPSSRTAGVGDPLFDFRG